MDVRLYQKIKVILFNDFSPPSLIDDAFEKKKSYLLHYFPKWYFFSNSLCT